MAQWTYVSDNTGEEFTLVEAPASGSRVTLYSMKIVNEGATPVTVSIFMDEAAGDQILKIPMLGLETHSHAFAKGVDNLNAHGVFCQASNTNVVNVMTEYDVTGV